MVSIRTVDSEGTIRYKNAKGSKGLYHRLDGPAVESPYGFNAWYKNGVRHREDGPAVEYADGAFSYYLNGIYYNTKEEWEIDVVKLKLKRIKDL